jgi:hypothetical protein
MTKSIRELWQSTFLAFCKLNQIQFSAPWNAHPRGC